MLATNELLPEISMYPASALGTNWESYQRVLEAQLTLPSPAESVGSLDSQMLQLQEMISGEIQLSIEQAMPRPVEHVLSKLLFEDIWLKKRLRWACQH